MLDSSIASDWQVRHVFMDLLLLADWHGVVDMTPESIARRTNVPLDIVKAGIDALCAPDPQSRTPDEEGRRLLPLSEHRDWGWQIVNFKAYREMRDEDAKREYMKGWMRKKRAAVSQELAPLADKDAEKEVGTKEEAPLPVGKLSHPTPPYDGIKDAWNAMASKNGLPTCMKLSTKRVASLRSRWADDYWRDNYANALGKITTSAFLKGSTGWKVSFDWIISPDAVLKIMEGKYDGGNKLPPGSEAARHTAASERFRDANKRAARVNDPPEPPHPLIARLRELMKATNSAILTAIDGGTEWRAYAIDKETVFLDAMVDGKSVQKRVKADALTQFKELL